MKHQRHHLVTTILVTAIVIGFLSYFFHPDVGTFKLIIDGQPIENPIIRFAAIPSGIIVMLLISLLAVLAVMGVGVLIFFIALFVSLLGVFLIAPFFWPLLLVIFLMLALMSIDNPKN